jgi:hypothetical protein
MSVLKFKVVDDIFFLMRRDAKWGDVSFIGGHVSDKDGGDFRRAAYRELLEEVPVLRSQKESIRLRPLSEELLHGPIFSPSANTLTQYDIAFFHISFIEDPSDCLALLTSKSANLLLSETEILNGKSFALSGWVRLLDQHLLGGLHAIELSWPRPLKIDAPATIPNQFQLDLKHRN